MKKAYGYYFEADNKLVHLGATRDPKRREKEHRLEYPNGKLRIVGRLTETEFAQMNFGIDEEEV